MMKRFLGIGLVMLTLVFTESCKKDHCDDGENNRDETGVDCGGLDCEPCVSCYDGVQNQNETGVDCGGSCEPCDLPWTKVLSGLNDLEAVDFHNDFGIAVGKGGLVLKSTDQGRTWTEIASGTTEDLNEVHVRDETHFYIAGSNDVVLISSDGSTISVRNTGKAETWNDIHFSNELEGVVCGSKMRIMYTIDGGQNWSVVFEKPSSPYHFQTMFFMNDNEGFAFGGIEFRQTLDGGRTWLPIDEYKRTTQFKDYRSLYYRTTRDAYCITDDGMFLLIPDANSTAGDGEFWVNKQQNVADGKIDFLTTTGLYAGRNSSKSEGKVLISFDGGVRWKKQSVDGSVYYSDGEVISEDVMVVVGENGTILRRDK